MRREIFYILVSSHDTVYHQMTGSVRISMRVPPTGRVFRNGAADEILRTLVMTPEKKFTVPELIELTETSRATVERALDLLERIDVINVEKTPRKRRISIDQTHLDKSDPVLAIEQSEFQKPVSEFVDETLAVLSETEDVNEIIGIVLYGSVARGEADRRSDIDLLIVVDGQKTVARRVVGEIAAELRNETFDGERYDFQPMVESVESVRRIGERLHQQFDEGIPLHATEELLELQREVTNGE